MSKAESSDHENESYAFESCTNDSESLREESRKNPQKDTLKAEQEGDTKCSADGESDYSIFNYFKKTPAILISFVSGAVAVVSFLINYAIYLQTSRELQYWNVDPAVVSSSNKHLFYMLCFSVIFILLLFGISALISKSFVSYFPFQMLARQLRLEMKSNQKYCKQAIKDSRSIKKALKMQNSCEYESLIRQESELNVFEKTCREGLQKLNSLRKRLSVCKRQNRKPITENLLVAFLLLLFSYAIRFQTDFSTSICKILLKALVFATLHFITCCFACLLTNSIVGHQRIKAKSENEVFSEFEEKLSSVEYPLQRLSKNRIKSMLSNGVIKMAFLNSVISMLVLFLVIVFATGTKPTNVFKSVIIDETQYVAVYTDSESMVLEEVTIENGRAQVDTTKQLIIPIYGIKYEVIRFGEVERIESSVVDS